MDWFLGGIILFVGGVVGIIVGKCFAKLCQSIINKKLIENAKKVINGKGENKCEIDGQIVEVKKFRSRNKDGDDEIITFGDGGAKMELASNKPKPNPTISNKEKQPDTKKKGRIKKSGSHKKKKSTKKLKK